MGKIQLGGFTMAKLAIACLAASALFSFCSVGRADLVAHYRFESGLVSDSSGNGNTLSDFGSLSQFSIPASGRGAFPNPIPLTGDANTMAAEFSGGRLQRDFGSPAVSGNLTLEAFIHADSLSAPFGRAIVMNINIPTTPTQGFDFQVRTDGALGTQPGELLFGVYDTSRNPHHVGSDFIMSEGKDYYVAVSFDDSTNTAVYYRKNLTDGTPLETNTVDFGGTWDMQGEERLAIGAHYDGGFGFDWGGLIDEVRISDSVLGPGQLLITAIPEPSSFLFGSAISALVIAEGFRRKKIRWLTPRARRNS
jgi:hypothetical protein